MQHQTDFLFSTDLALAKLQISDYVKQLNAAEEKPTQRERIEQSDALIEAYIAVTGQRPVAFVLYALGSYIIDDYLTDQHKQHRKDEYPFKTDARMTKNHARNRTIFLGDRTDVTAK